MDPYAWAANVEGVTLVAALAVAYWLVLQRFPAGRWRIACFAGAELVLLAVLVTPVHTIALNHLLSAHLLQNVVLAEWAPGLLVLALPPALAATLARRPVVRAVTHPLVALPTWLVVYFAWHVPALYDAALEQRGGLLHLEHMSYFAAGCLLWCPVVHDAPHRLASAAKAAYVFAAFAFASPLGLLLALLPEPIYGFYERAPNLWGLSDVADQQIAGVTMASEEAVVFFVVFAVYFLRFLREQEREEGELARALE